jgi:hypothetical protein
MLPFLGGEEPPGRAVLSFAGGEEPPRRATRGNYTR